MSTSAALSTLGLLAPIALLLALWGVAWRNVRRGHDVSRGVRLAAAFVPPLLVAAVLASSAERFGDLRVSLEGLRFRFDPAAPRTVSIGGSRESDHLFVPGLPAGFLTAASQGGEIRLELHPTTDANADGNDERASEADQQRLGAIRLVPKGPGATVSKEPFVNTIELGDGDRIEVAGADGGPWTWSAARRGLSSPEGELPPLPSRRGPFGIKIGRELPPSVAIHPLRDVAASRHADGVSPLLGADGAPIGAFFSRGGGYQRKGVFLTLTEPGVRVVRANGEAFEFVSNVTTLTAGAALEVALHRVDIQDPEPTRASPTTVPEPGDSETPGFFTDLRATLGGGDRLRPPSRTQERRSFTLRFARSTGARAAQDGESAGAPSLEIDFDSPTHVQISQAALAELERRVAVARSSGEALDEEADAQDQEPPPALLSLTPERFALHAGEGEMILSFAALGEPLGAEIYSRIEPPNERHRDALRLIGHAGVRDISLGASFAVGESSAAILRVARLGAPWGAIALVVAAAFAAAAAGFALRARLVPFVVLTGVDALLALRVLIAYEGAYLDAAAAAAAWESLATFALVPFGLHLAFAAVGNPLSLRFARRSSPPFDVPLLPLAVHAAITFGVTAVALVRAELGLGSALFAFFGTTGFASLVGAVALPILDRLFARSELESTAPSAWRRQTTFWALAGSLVIFRLATLFLLGWKERIDLGGLRFAVSIVYVPWALLVLAIALRDRDKPWGVARLLAVLGVLFAAIPFFARDLGAILIFSIPPILLLALPAFESSGGGKIRWLRFALATPLVLVLVAFVGLPLAFQLDPLPSIEEARDNPAAAEELVAEKAAVKRNHLRFWNLMAPEALQRLGTTESEGFVTVMENLRAYAARGPFGEGYLAVPLSAPLANTHLNDNLSAVHLLGPFGWLGALVVLLLFSGWIVVSVIDVQGAPSLVAPTSQHAWGLLLLWTLAIAALYMISANVELLWFTGKNLYFLAASSLSDAAEGALLVALALWALAPRQGSRGVTP